MTASRRIQLSRTKGWRKPANTVVVARPTKWGNPYRIGSNLTNPPNTNLLDRAWDAITDRIDEALA